MDRQILILITAGFRLDNLYSIAKTININYDKYSEYFDIYWLICVDQFNRFGNIDKCINYLKCTNIKYKIVNSGLNQEKNYGGALYNEPLQYLVETELNNSDNCWVYVLDDDNIVHPYFYDMFKVCLDNNFYDNKEIITTQTKFHVGHIRDINDYTFNTNNVRENKPVKIRTSEYGLFDPSGVILKYNIIKKYGMYSNEYLYDWYWLNPLLEKEYDNIIWYNYYQNSYGRHIVHTYHNGLITQDMIEPFKDKEDNVVDVIFYNQNIEYPISISILSKENQKKIYNIIENEIKKLKE